MNDKGNFISRFVDNNSITLPNRGHKDFSYLQSNTGSLSSLGAGKTSKTGSMNRSSTMNYDAYFESMYDFSYLKAIVNAIKGPVQEIIKGVGSIKIRPSKEREGVENIESACTIVNTFFKNSNFKEHLLRNLDKFILRGSFLSRIDYVNNTIVDLINPHKYKMILQNNKIKWVLCTDANQTGQSYNYSSLNSLNINTTNASSDLIFNSNLFFNYYYDLEDVDVESGERLNRSLNGNMSSEEKVQLESLLGTSLLKASHQKVPAKTQEQLNKITALYKTVRPKSLLEPHMKALFNLNLKQMVYDILSLLIYMKPQFFAVNFRDSVDDDHVQSIIKGISSAVNRYNPEFISRFEDPSGIISVVIDKLMTQTHVVPSNELISDIQALEIPDITNRIVVLANDIRETKITLSQEIGVTEEVLSGGANRWEAIARSDKYAIFVNDTLTTIARYIKKCAAVVYYNHTNEKYWEETTYKKVSVSEEESYKQHGIELTINDFLFEFDTRFLMDSYSSRGKETIMAERIQGLTTIVEGLHVLFQQTFINKESVQKYIESGMSQIEESGESFIKWETVLQEKDLT